MRWRRISHHSHHVHPFCPHLKRIHLSAWNTLESHLTLSIWASKIHPIKLKCHILQERLFWLLQLQWASPFIYVLGYTSISFSFNLPQRTVSRSYYHCFHFLVMKSKADKVSLTSETSHFMFMILFLTTNMEIRRHALKSSCKS